jgi:hypothetical protein
MGSKLHEPTSASRRAHEDGARAALEALPAAVVGALRGTRSLEAARDIEATLAEADAWLEMSGAKSYEPFLHEERAKLAKLPGDELQKRELEVPVRGHGAGGVHH